MALGPKSSSGSDAISGHRVRRGVDVATSLAGLIALAPLLVFIGVLVKLTSKGPALYWSDRVGVNNTVFRMPKFRTMRVDAPVVATHLMDAPHRYLTPIGAFLRRSSLDELPQLIAILRGDITFVGPRPALFNQEDLIALRTAHGVHKLVPGLTGWAQVNGRDTLTIERKVEFDREYLQKRSFFLDLKIIALTILRVIRGAGVTH